MPLDSKIEVFMSVDGKIVWMSVKSKIEVWIHEHDKNYE